MPCSVIKLTPHTTPAKKSWLSLATKKRQAVEGRRDATSVAAASVAVLASADVAVANYSYTEHWV